METDGALQASLCNVAFEDLRPALSQEVLSVLESQGFHRATPVQAAAIPLFLSHKDVVAEAITGSGKTLAFVIPVLEILRRLSTPLKRHQVAAIILSPTRELANQIASVATPFLASLPWLSPCALLVGGSSVQADIDRLADKGAHVIIGTPGRVDDVMTRADFLDFRTVEVAVLDEADRLLDLGFTRQVSSILERLPKQRRTALFSATQSQAVREVARAGMRDPVRVRVKVQHMQPTAAGGGQERGGGEATTSAAAKGEGRGGEEMTMMKTPPSLRIEALVCSLREKPSRVVQFLQQHSDQKIILFVMTCACVDYWASVLPLLPSLSKSKFFALHGKMKQSIRESALSKFAALDKSGVLLCTDVAARGLDLPGVDCILQMDAPQDPKCFVHRAGRTARMGRQGSTLVLLDEKEDTYVEYLRLQSLPVQLLENPEDDPPPPDITEQIREQALKDRAVMEKGLRAFVSFVRGYKEHHCNFIFRWKELNLGQLAMAFGLLKLPAMPELKKRKAAFAEFTEAQGLDLDAIKYRDRSREKQRLQNLKLKAQELAEGASKARPRHDKKRPGASSTKPQGKRPKSKRSGDEIEELNREYRLLKKLKRGKLSNDQFDKATEESGM